MGEFYWKKFDCNGEVFNELLWFYWERGGNRESDSVENFLRCFKEKKVMVEVRELIDWRDLMG